MSHTSTYKFFYIPRSAVVASILLHLTFPVGLLTLKILDYFDIQLFAPKKTMHQVYQDFVQVDMVALPDVAIKDLPKVDVTAPLEDTASSSAVPEDDAMVLEAKRKAEEREKKVKEEQEKKKALAKLEEEARREAALKALQEEGKRSRKKLKGNILSQGAAATGNLGTAKDRYDSLIAARIKKYFTVFPGQEKRGLVSTVYLELFPTGRVREKRLEKTSGDIRFDDSVLQAIDEAQPFPLPDDMSLLQGGLTIVFQADELPRVK